MVLRPWYDKNPVPPPPPEWPNPFCPPRPPSPPRPLFPQLSSRRPLFPRLRIGKRKEEAEAEGNIISRRKTDKKKILIQKNTKEAE